MLKNQSIAVTEQVPWLSGERHWNSHAACGGIPRRSWFESQIDSQYEKIGRAIQGQVTYILYRSLLFLHSS